MPANASGDVKPYPFEGSITLRLTAALYLAASRLRSCMSRGERANAAALSSAVPGALPRNR
jgi:hypothetical protein